MSVDVEQLQAVFRLAVAIEVRSIFDGEVRFVVFRTLAAFGIA
jgi:hypothetical protein